MTKKTAIECMNRIDKIEPCGKGSDVKIDLDKKSWRYKSLLVFWQWGKSRPNFIFKFIT